ncbi:MAG TPA: CHAD domain-containing protein [Terriglobales bacterium]|jgi:CHAD domain-containing protein|nr:CHAD domain-containing protein [Terriglobales bacterium]
MISSDQSPKVGLTHWMQQVLTQADSAAEGFESGAVHDLRTALRRCRSIADGAMVFDPDPAWKKMRRAGKQLFQSLGALRDTHVLTDWLGKLAPDGDQTAQSLSRYLQLQEQELRGVAARALQQFDRIRWNRWAAELPSHLGRIPLDSGLFGHLALERWNEASALHRRALRNRSNVAFHDLRIGIKRLRYTIENFLPALHEFWGADLKEVQDALGDVHDLDVLWATALRVNAFPDLTSRDAWRVRIQVCRQACLARYRHKMVGNSQWKSWRGALPKDEQLRDLGLQRLELWASFLDPNLRHACHVRRLSMQIFDGTSGALSPRQCETSRFVLQAAALLHDVGRAKTNKGHHKESARLIRKLRVPLGWSAEEIGLAALVARYHRGALPGATQKRFSAAPRPKQFVVQFLSGILRLACAFDTERNEQIRKLDVECTESVLKVWAQGYGAGSPMAEHLARARYLLEVAYNRPVFISPAEVTVA